MTAHQQTARQPQPIAIVGLGAIMPEAPTASAFWANITEGRYCITDVPKDRWDPDLYYDPDPRATGKSYSRIGGWVREFPWDPIGWRLPLPPKVSDQMDDGQKWSVAAARAALLDAGWPDWNVDPERVGHPGRPGRETEGSSRRVRQHPRHQARNASGIRRSHHLARAAAPVRDPCAGTPARCPRGGRRRAGHSPRGRLSGALAVR